MLIELTKQYIDAFDTKNVIKLSDLLSDSFSIEDPVVKRIEGKSECIEAIKNIFDSCDKLSFQAKNLYLHKQTTIIEFMLQIDDVVLEGVDIIEWKNNKMHALRAYLDIPRKELE
jgi:hypothetical protein